MGSRSSLKFIYIGVIAMTSSVVHTKPSNARHAQSYGASQDHNRHARSISCTPLSDSQLWTRYLDYVTTEATYPESFYMVPVLRQLINESLSKSSGNTTLADGKREVCALSTDAHAPLRERSTCPWYTVYNTDSDRFPVRLIEAACSTCGSNHSYACRDEHGPRPEMELSCVPQYYSVRVLRRSTEASSDGTCLYDNGWQKLSAGCTCAKKLETSPSK